MSRIVRSVGKGAGILALALVLGVHAPRAETIDLGFALDGSGSIGSSDFSLEKNGLAAALLANIPYAGGTGKNTPNGNTYRISVVEFGTTAGTPITVTVNSQADLTNLVTQVQALSYFNTNTCISCATTALTNAFVGLGGLSNHSLINISTDGVPNQGTTNAATLRAALLAAGWDGVSAEAIGSFDNTFLSGLVYPIPAVDPATVATLPDPFQHGFVLPVTGFAQYSAAIDAKIANIVNVPFGGVGGGLPGLIVAFGGVIAWGRRRLLRAA